MLILLCCLYTSIRSIFFILSREINSLICVVCTLLMLTLHIFKGKLFCCVGEFIEPPNHLVLVYAQLDIVSAGIFKYMQLIGSRYFMLSNLIFKIHRHAWFIVQCPQEKKVMSEHEQYPHPSPSLDLNIWPYNSKLKWIVQNTIVLMTIEINSGIIPIATWCWAHL